MMANLHRHNTLPVDKGWAWAIAAAGFIAHVIMGGASQTNSVLFVEILRHFNITITTGSMMFMCNTLAFSFTSVVTTTFVMPKLGERACLIIGGLLNVTLTLVASFSTNVGIFIAVLSLKGVGHGLIFVPSLSLIRYYFEKRRSRASMIPWCGGSMSSIIGPFIIRALRKEFGISGAYFILSAVELNYIVAALLLRPVSTYRFRPDDVDGSANENKEDKTTPAITTSNYNELKEKAAMYAQRDASTLQMNGVDDINDDKAIREALMAPVRERLDTATEEKIITRIRELNDTTKDKGIGNRDRVNTLLGSVLTLDSDVGTAMEMMVEDVCDGPEEKSLTVWQRIYQDSSLELWSFRWAVLSMLPGTVNIYLLSYLPTIANSQGASLDQAALLVTIMGSVDMVSRICTGFIADAHVLRASQMLAIAQVCIGLASHVYRFSTTFPTLIAITVFIGIFIGSRGPMNSLMCLEVVGTKKMPQAYSISSMLCTLVGASFNPILAAVVEATGSFIPVLHIIGSSYIVGALFLSLLPLFIRLDSKAGRIS